jgi:hypothetical protein
MLEKIITIFIVTWFILLLLALALLFAFHIYCWVVYGGKPVSELPTYIVWVMYC